MEVVCDERRNASDAYQSTGKFCNLRRLVDAKQWAREDFILSSAFFRCVGNREN